MRKKVKKWRKVNYERAYALISLGFDKKRVMKELGISERSYYKAKRQFDALPPQKKADISTNAKAIYDERIFDKDYWFKDGVSMIPIIQKWHDTLLMRNVSKKGIRDHISKMRGICLGLKRIQSGGKVTDRTKVRIRDRKIPPELFTEEDGVQWIVELKKRGIMRTHNDRATIRSFLQFAKGIVPTRISGHKEGYGKRARDFFEPEEVDKILYVIDTQFPKEEAQDLRMIAKFLMYTATRIHATLKVVFHDVAKYKTDGTSLMQVSVFDKGRRTDKNWDSDRSGVRWDKLILPRFAKDLEDYLTDRRKKTARLARGENQRLFPFNYDGLRQKLKKIYEIAVPNRKIHQPFHIWRHTFAMMMLRETGWNYELVAELGGWKGTDVLKECYGSPQKRDVAKFIVTKLA